MVIVIVLSKIIQSSQKSKESCNSIVFLTRQRDLHLSSLPTFKETELGRNELSLTPRNSSIPQKKEEEMKASNDYALF